MLVTRKASIVGLVAVLLVVLGVMAMNQYEVARVTGVIIQSGTSVITATVQLENISSAANFSATGYGSITVEEAEGLDITRFLVVPWDTSYWNDRFYTYTLNFTVDGDTWTIPFMVGGDLQNSLALGWSDGYYHPWSIYHLTQGYHSMTLTVYGKTQVSATDMNVDNSFYIDLSV